MVPRRRKRSGARVTSHPSYLLFGLAGAASTRAVTEPREALTAIILSAIAVEAFFNDVVEILGSNIATGKAAGLEDIISVCDVLEENRVALFVRLHVAHQLLTHTPLPDGQSPLEDFRLLMTLRNKLVHKKPETSMILPTTPDMENADLVRSLVKRGVIEELPQYNFPMLSSYLAAPGVGAWAYDTAKGVAHFLIAMIPPGDAREAVVSLFWHPLDGTLPLGQPPT